jgi:hypothetical protein
MEGILVIKIKEGPTETTEVAHCTALQYTTMTKKRVIVTPVCSCKLVYGDSESQHSFRSVAVILIILIQSVLNNVTILLALIFIFFCKIIGRESWPSLVFSSMQFLL